MTSDGTLNLTEIDGVSGKVYYDPNTSPSPSKTPPSKKNPKWLRMLAMQWDTLPADIYIVDSVKRVKN